MTRIVVHIDRLVLRGVAPNDATALSEAIHAELGQLLGNHPDIASLTGKAVRGSINAGSVNASNSPQGTGKTIAMRIAGCL